MAKYYIDREELSKIWPRIEGAAPNLSGATLYQLMSKYCEGTLPGHPNPPNTKKLGERSYGNYLAATSQVTDPSVISALRSIFSESVLTPATDEIETDIIDDNGVCDINANHSLGLNSESEKAEVLSPPATGKQHITNNHSTNTNTITIHAMALSAIIAIQIIAFVFYGIFDIILIPDYDACHKYQPEDLTTALYSHKDVGLHLHCLSLVGFISGSLSIVNFGAFSIFGGFLLALYSTHVEKLKASHILIGSIITSALYSLISIRNTSNNDTIWHDAWSNGVDFFKVAIASLVTAMILYKESKGSLTTKAALTAFLFIIVGLFVSLDEEPCQENVGCVDIWSRPSKG